MSTTPKHPLVGFRSLSNLTGLNREVIRESITRAGIDPAGQVGGHPAFDLKDALHALFARRGEADPATLSPIERRAIAQARLQEFELQRRQGLYVLRTDLVQSNSTAYARVASTCRSIPDNLERRCGISSDAAEDVERVIEDILDGLADAMLHAYQTGEFPPEDESLTPKERKAP